MEKLAIVVAPLVLYAAVLGVRKVMGKMPNRHALNVETSVLLVLYFFITAGLGVFWVANQQLPPFDWHYLFGYLTATLVVVHLAFNLRIVLRHVRRPRAAGAPRPRGSAPVGILRPAAYAIGLGAAFFAGMRAGKTEIVAAAGPDVAASMAPILSYHAFSSHSRAGVLLRAPSVTWGGDAPRYADRSALQAVALPKPDLERRSSGPMSVDDLSVLLWATAGITDRRGTLELRAAASSGALFPTEVYAIVRAIDGLDPGVYAYRPQDHGLALVGRDVPSLAALGAAEVAEPPLVLVFTCVFRRSGQKYRDRAYRYAVADAGHAIGNTVQAGGALDIGVALLPRFDDQRVAAAVGADNQEEGVVAAAAVGRGLAPRVAPSALVGAPLDEAVPLPLGATSLAHRATSLVAASPQEERPPTLVLPDATPVRQSVLELIAARRSVREYGARALTLDELGHVMAHALAAEPSLSRSLRFTVIANRVAGLGPGVYRYEPTTRGLSVVHAGEHASEAGRAALDQEVVRGAPAVVVVSLDREVLAAEGPRAYRQAFVEAGLVGARLYLAVAEASLGGCSVGAFYDEEAARLLGVSLDDEWPAHFFAFGPPQG